MNLKQKNKSDTKVKCSNNFHLQKFTFPFDPLFEIQLFLPLKMLALLSLPAMEQQQTTNTWKVGISRFRASRFYTPVSARSRQTFVFTARNQNSLDPGQKVARFNNGGEEGGEGRGFEKSGKTSGGSIGSVSAATNQPPPWKHGRIEEEIETRKGRQKREKWRR